MSLLVCAVLASIASTVTPQRTPTCSAALARAREGPLQPLVVARPSCAFPVAMCALSQGLGIAIGRCRVHVRLLHRTCELVLGGAAQRRHIPHHTDIEGAECNKGPFPVVKRVGRQQRPRLRSVGVGFASWAYRRVATTWGYNTFWVRVYRGRIHDVHLSTAVGKAPNAVHAPVEYSAFGVGSCMRPAAYS